jgi:hypothetical protein
LALNEAVISGDSGNPVFLILRGELVLISARTWSDGSGTSYTHFANLASGGTTSPTDPTVNTLSINDLIAQTDVVAGVSTGYQVKYFDFTGALGTSLENEDAKTNLQFYTSNCSLIVNLNSDELSVIQVFDLFGRQIINQKLVGFKSTIRLPRSGIYVVMVTSNDQTQTFKILAK